MIVNYLFSKYFATTVVFSLLFTFLLPYMPILAMPLFFSLFFVNAITLHLFLHNKKLSQFFELPKENFVFSFNFAFYLILFFVLNLLFDFSQSTYSSYNYLLLFISMMIVPIVSIDISSLAILKNKLTFSQQISLFKSKEKFKTLLLSSLIFAILSQFVNPFLLVNFMIVYAFFTYFFPSKYFRKVDTE
tara:strand:+ start:268 stop:834 length:567 start_codon:yes stop_codon:yes gene_type:complete